MLFAMNMNLLVFLFCIPFPIMFYCLEKLLNTVNHPGALYIALAPLSIICAKARMSEISFPSLVEKEFQEFSFFEQKALNTIVRWENVSRGSWDQYLSNNRFFKKCEVGPISSYVKKKIKNDCYVIKSRFRGFRFPLYKDSFFRVQKWSLGNIA